jgi:hypothetical protein
MTYDRSIKMFDEPHAPVLLEKLVTEKSINKGKFLSKEHSESYRCQMQTISSLHGIQSILEVGPGEGYCARNLRQLGYLYETLDFEEAYEPTIKADFRSLDASTIPQRYDLTCAFQVLEHFPYDEFAKHLGVLRDLSNKYVFISLPYSCRGFSISFNLHSGQRMGPMRRFDCYIRTNLPNRKVRPEFKEEFPWAVHHWEIGRKGFGLKKVLGDIESCGLKIKKRFHSPNPFHYFILCWKDGSQ